MNVMTRGVLCAGLMLSSGSLFATDWYVDANYGNDDWDGSCLYADRDENAKKGPKKTLAAAMAITDLAKGDVVHAARGHYNEGGEWDDDNTNRVVIAKAIGLVADEGRDVTFIEGALSTDPTAQACGNGPGAVRCVKFTTDKGAYLKGFTVCNGRTSTTNPSAWDCGGGCISVCGGSAIIDCVVTNGNSAYRGIVSGWSGTTMIGCRVYAPEMANAAGSTYTAYGKIDFINCVVSGLTLGSSTGGLVINSTFTTFGPWKAQAVYNSYDRAIQSNDNNTNCKYYNCYYVSKSSDAKIDETYPGLKITEAEARFDASTWRQQKGSVLIDAGVKALYDDNFPSDWKTLAADVDVYGQSRVLGATIDIGACEYGGLPSDVRAILSDHPAFDVTGLTGGTYATGSDVALPAGGGLTLSWALASGEVTSNEFSVVASVGAGVTLLAYLDDDATPLWTLVGVDGVQTNFYLAGQHTLRLKSLGGTSTVSSVGTDVKTPYFVKPTGDDTADGKTMATARKTLKAAMEISGLVAGDIVYAAPGVYDEGAMWDGDNSNRVVVTQGVGLIGYAGPTQTAIEGMWDPVSTNGPAAARCVYLRNGSFVQGFTLRNGATAAVLQSGTENGYISGGNVYADAGGCLIDCIVTNGVAKYRGGGIASFYAPGGNYIRCYIGKNLSVDGPAHGAYHGNFYNCVFDGYNSNIYGKHVHLVNCSVLGSSSLRGNGAAYAYNSTFGASEGGNVTYARCLVGFSSIKSGNNSVAVDGTLLGQTDLASKVDANYRPKTGTSLVDYGDVNHCLTNFPAAFVRFRDRDFAGGQRVYNGAIDIGPGEYDWRGDFAKTLNRKGVAVVAADANVTTNVLAGLDVAAGETVKLRITLQKTGGTCSVTVTGTPVVKVGGQTLTGVGGVYSFSGISGSAYDLEIIAPAEAAVTVSSVTLPKAGLLLLVQ